LEFVEIGVDVIRAEHKKGNPEYAQLTDVEQFIQEFRSQASEYLWFLAGQTPKAKFATAELSGKNIGKLMGALGCKAGLWWAKKHGKPVYYCLDGIKMEDVLSYKIFKNKMVNAYFTTNVKHFEVITLAEMREILKHWDELKGTVRFIEKGKIKTNLDEVAAWIKRMAVEDMSAEKRLAPNKQRFAKELNELDPKLLNNSALTDHDAMRIVIQSENLKMAANAKKDMLIEYLENECDKLYEWGILPKDLALACKKVRDSSVSLEERASAFEALRLQLSSLPDSLKAPLSNKLLKPPGTRQ
jgi:hypothetical protein